MSERLRYDRYRRINAAAGPDPNEDPGTDEDLAPVPMQNKRICLIARNRPIQGVDLSKTSAAAEAEDGLSQWLWPWKAAMCRAMPDGFLGKGSGRTRPCAAAALALGERNAAGERQRLHRR